MLDRSELEIAIAAVLVAAMLVGWLLHVVWHRLARTPRTQAGRFAVVSSRLLAAEHARDAETAARLEAEARLTEAEARIADLEARLAEAEAALRPVREL
jgi:uncharacterized protein YceH (UPF0502 family)